MDTKIRLLPAIFVVLLFAVGRTASLSTTCPRQCRCDRGKNVYCMNKGLLKLPLGIPRDTKILFLQNNLLVNSPDLDSILGSLTSLYKLELSNNSLTSFPRNLPKSLQWISMKDNDIKYVGSQSLQGLHMLRTLYLDNNSITNQGLSPSAFSGAENLHTISLKWNRLTSFPLGLPSGIRLAHFGNNLIEEVPKAAVQQLTRVMSLDLNNNYLGSRSFENNALRYLIELRYLDLSHNKLTYIPNNLPGNLTRLLASHNLVKSINAPAIGQERHMSLSGMTFMEHLDLSYNRLQSVEPESFSSLISLRTVILHDNPWQCDCHLKYLKTWLMDTEALITMDSNTICFTPDAFQGVTLRSLDHVSLTCAPKQVPKYNISVSQKSVVLSWMLSDTNYPDYVEYKAFCGEPKCENCSQRDIINTAEREEYTYVSSVVKSYHEFLTDYENADKGIAQVDISNLRPGQLYIICLLGSYKHISELTIEDCDFVQTENLEPTATAPPQTAIPAWLGILIGILAVMVLAAIILVVYCQRLNAEKYKWKRATREQQPQMTYDPFHRVYTMTGADSRNERAYNSSAAGGVNISNFREGFMQGSATQDAGKEFDVTLMVNSASNHNLLHVPSPETCESYCSDCHEDTISTSHTRTNTTDGSIGSQPDGHHHGRHHPMRYEGHVPRSNGYITS